LRINAMNLPTNCVKWCDRANPKSGGRANARPSLLEQSKRVVPPKTRITMNATGLIRQFTHVPVPDHIRDWPLGSLYDLTTNPVVPIGTAIAYFITVHLLNPKPGEKRKPLLSGPLFTALVLAHSTYMALASWARAQVCLPFSDFALFFFSLITFVNSMPAVVSWLSQHKGDHLTGVRTPYFLIVDVSLARPALQIRSTNLPASKCGQKIRRG